MTRGKSIAIAVVFVCALALAGGGLWLAYRGIAPVPAPIARAAVAVRLAWLHQAQFAGMYVAKEKGLYDAAKLDVDLKEYSFDVNNIQELVDGDVQFTVVSAEEVLRAADQGLPIKAIAAIYQTTPYVFASLTSSGIKSPADFAGHALGNEGGNQQAVVTYGALLKEFGIAESDVNYVNLDFDEVNDLVKHRADTVDIYRTDQPYRFKKAGVDINLIYPEQYGFQIYGDVLVTTDDMIEHHADIVQRFVDATLAGWTQALEQPEAAVDTLMPYTHDQYADRDYEEYILNESARLIRPSPGFEIGTMQYVPWQQAYQAYKDAGAVTQDLDATSLYTSQFLN